MKLYHYEKELGMTKDELKMKDDSRHPQWKEERKKYGFDERETWGLDTTIAQFMYTRLMMFKECKNGHPCNMTGEEWDALLQEMIDGFGGYLIYEASFDNEDKWEIVRDNCTKSFELLSKHWRELWW